MKVNLDKNIILENIGVSTRPPVSSIPPSPEFGRNPNPSLVKDPNKPQVINSGDTMSFAQQKLKYGSKIDSSAGLRTLLKNK
jgi:hypothetical protein